LVVSLLCLAMLLATLGDAHSSPATHPSQAVTSTFTLGSTLSTPLSQSQIIFNASFTVLSTTGTTALCEFWTLNFTAAVGQYVSGNFTSDNPVSFYIVQVARYQSWLKAGTCGNPGDAIASQPITTEFSFNRAIPSSGTWTIVLVNSSNAKNADGSLTAYLSSGSYTVTQPLMSTLTTTVVSSAVVQPTAVGGFSFASIVFVVMIGLVVGIVGGLIAIFILRRRNHG